MVQHLQDPDLVALVRSFGQDPGPDERASDARSWEDYAERMGYIACFFRAYLGERPYFDEPREVRDHAT